MGSVLFQLPPRRCRLYVQGPKERHGVLGPTGRTPRRLRPPLSLRAASREWCQIRSDMELRLLFSRMALRDYLSLLYMSSRYIVRLGSGRSFVGGCLWSCRTAGNDWRRPSSFSALSHFCGGRAFVKMSAACAAVSTYWMDT